MKNKLLIVVILLLMPLCSIATPSNIFSNYKNMAINANTDEKIADFSKILLGVINSGPRNSAQTLLMMTSMSYLPGGAEQEIFNHLLDEGNSANCRVISYSMINEPKQFYEIYGMSIDSRLEIIRYMESCDSLSYEEKMVNTYLVIRSLMAFFPDNKDLHSLLLNNIGSQLDSRDSYLLSWHYLSKGFYYSRVCQCLDNIAYAEDYFNEIKEVISSGDVIKSELIISFQLMSILELARSSSLPKEIFDIYIKGINSLGLRVVDHRV